MREIKGNVNRKEGLNHFPKGKVLNRQVDSE
jgi:hypothetical protein